MPAQSIVLMVWWTLFCMTSAARITISSYVGLVPEDLKVSCPASDSCRNRATNYNYPGIKYTCECERHCAERGTCCIDSPYIDSYSSPARQQCIQSAETLSCKIPPHIWTVNRCKPGWNKSSKIQKLCEGDAQSLSNVLMLVPAENPISGYVYRNIYCAACNDDRVNVLLWKFGLHVKSSDDFGKQMGIFPEDIKYEENLGWGYWHSLNPGESVFRSGSVIIYSPPWPQREKKCRSDIIRSCIPSWKDVEVQKKCESYMAVVRGPMELIDGEYVRRVFKNIHCVVCNNVFDLEDVTCDQYYEDKIGIVNVIVANCTEPGSAATAYGYGFSTGTVGGSIMTTLFGRNMGTQNCPEEREKYDNKMRMCAIDV